MKSKTSTKPRNIFYTYLKRFKLVIIILVLVAAYALAHNIWIHNREVEDYKQKPLVSGVDFLKREYTSGCLALDLIMCTLGPEMTYYYYETDLSLQELIISFPGWKGDLPKDTVAFEWPILITNSQTGQEARMRYINDPKYFKTLLKDTGLHVSENTKALVRISKDDYQKLTQH